MVHSFGRPWTILYYFLLHYHLGIIWVLICVCPASIISIMCCISFFPTNMEFDWPFHLTWRRIASRKSPHLVLAEWLTELSKKQKREKQLPGETVWSRIEKLLEVRTDVRDMPEIAGSNCQTFLCHRHSAIEYMTFPSNFLLMGKVHATQYKSERQPKANGHLSWSSSKRSQAQVKTEVCRLLKKKQMKAVI